MNNFVLSAILAISVLTTMSFISFQDVQAASMTFASDTTINTEETISAGETWTVNAGVTLTLNGNVNNFGTIINFGTIVLNNGNLFNESGAIVTNSGTIIVSASGSIENKAGGTINNSNTITNQPSGFVDNQGTINQSCGATYTGELSGNSINTLPCPPGDRLVGGEIIPVETTALLLAGAQSNLSWIVTAVVIAAGASVFLIRRK